MQDKELRWLVESRSKIQAHLLELLILIRRDDQRRWLTQRAVYANIFGLLVGSGYSLWRAVFLMDRKKPLIPTLEEARDFLELLVRDNAIAYVQESKTGAWTSKYYLNSAVYRMRRVAMKLEEANVQVPSQLRATLNLNVDFDEEGMSNAWEVCYAASCATLPIVTKSRGIEGAAEIRPNRAPRPVEPPRGRPTNKRGTAKTTSG